MALVFGGGFPEGPSSGALLLVVPDEAVQVEGNPGNGPETFQRVTQYKYGKLGENAEYIHKKTFSSKTEGYG